MKKVILLGCVLMASASSVVMGAGRGLDGLGNGKKHSRAQQKVARAAAVAPVGDDGWETDTAKTSNGSDSGTGTPVESDGEGTVPDEGPNLQKVEILLDDYVRFQTIKRELRGAKAGAERARTEITNLQTRLDELTRESSTLRAQASDLQGVRSQLSSTQGMIDRFKEDAQDARSRAQALRDELSQEKGTSTSLAVRLSTIEGELRDAREAKSTLERKLLEADARVATLQAQIEEKDKSVRGVETKMAELYARDKQISEELIEARVHLKIFGATRGRTSSVTGSEDSSALMVSDGGHRSLDLAIRTTVSEVLAPMRDILEFARETQQELKAEQSRRVGGLEGQLARVIQERDANKQQGDELNALVTKLTGEQKLVQGKLDELNRQYRGLEGERNTLRGEQRNAQNRVTDLTGQLAGKDVTIIELGRNIATLRGERDGAVEKARLQEGDIGGLRAQLTEIRKQKTEAEATLTQKTSALMTLTEDLGKWKGYYDEMLKGRDAYMKERDTYKTAYDAALTRAKNAEDLNGTNARTIKNLKDRLKAKK